MKIPFVIWRDGRPRFIPSPEARRFGHKGHDLKNIDGSWFSAGQALDFSVAFKSALKVERTAKRPMTPAVRPPTKVRPSPPKVSARSYSVADLFREWLGSVDVAEKAPATIRDYRQKARVIEDHYRDIWTSEAEALSKPVMFGLYDIIRSRQGGHTASAVIRLFSNALTWGMNRGKLPGLATNPAQRLKMKKLPPRVRFATIGEIEAMLAAADAMGRPEMGDMIALGVWSGQRQNDRLTMQLVNLTDGRLRIQQNKTGAIVDMPVAPALKMRLDAAKERRRLAGKILPGLILDERRWQPFLQDHYRHLFDDIRRAARAQCPTVATLRDQDLRDTAVTWLALSNCSLWEICAITGHSFKTAGDILKHYLAIHPDMATEAMTKLVSWYEGKKEQN